MRLKELYVIALGFIILGLGISLLNLGDGSYFFIFPFFIAGDLAPFIMLSTLFIVMMCFWWANKNWVDDARYSSPLKQKPSYLRVETSCHFCGNPLPERAVFCYSCGNPVEEE